MGRGGVGFERGGGAQTAEAGPREGCEEVGRGGSQGGKEVAALTQDQSPPVVPRTLLVGSNLLNADFAEADLEGADVRSADLRLARNLTQEQLELAYGSSGQQEYMPDTLLPDHLKAPTAWHDLLSQQIEAKERSG